MKNLILLAIGATLLSTSAFASKARLEALGEDQFGSQYVDDNRNMFLNAAQIHNHADFLIFEAGNTSNVTDTAAGPKASGGYFARNGGAVYGVYLGQDSDTAAGLRAAPLAALRTAGAIDTVQKFGVLADAVTNDNTIDLFYGRDGAMKWGVRLSYSSSANEQGDQSGLSLYDEASQSGYLVGLGALSGDWEYYANIGATNTAEIKNIQNTTAFLNGKDMEVTGAIGVQAGAIKDLGNGAKGFVEIRSIGIEQDGLGTINTTDFDNKWDIQRVNLGWAKAEKMNDTFTGFYRVEYFQETNENFAYVDGYDVDISFVKATLGFEAIATSWLTLRGSVANNLISERDEDGGSNDGKKTIDGVDVAMGATVKFGDFSIDGLISNDTDGDGAMDEDLTDTTTEENDKNGVLRTDNLMSRVSFTYNF